ncbi:Phosphatidate cytidylyltransferase [hydrothermal vent metagenome]|uniref:Phosphatidate cytidylyltransferase n=1 Tax=hydrothermal vent metagenome TaxID=652676 RepID=A0A3B0WZM9_9ZZZZ
MFENIPQNSLLALFSMLYLIVVGSVGRSIIQKKNPDKDYTDLKQRIHSWWWIVGVLFIALIMDKNYAIIVLAIFSFIALKEFLSILPGGQVDRSVAFWAYLSIPVQYYFISIQAYDLFVVFIPIYIFLFLPIRMIFAGNSKDFIKSAGTMHWGVVLTVFSISHIAYLLVLPEKNLAAGNIGLVIFLLFMTQFNEVSQYVLSKMFGKHKIFPNFNSNKTWEGVLGGMILIVSVATIIGPLLTPLTRELSFFSGFLISFFGLIGGVVVSSIKRDLDTNASASVTPVRSGILDRFHGLVFTSPLFFHYLYVVAY